MKPISERHTIREILELSERPTLDEVKRNYKRLALKYHPDRNKDPEANEYMKKINQAYAVALQKAPAHVQPQQPVRQRVVIITVNIYGNANSSWTYSTGTNGFNW